MGFEEELREEEERQRKQFGELATALFEAIEHGEDTVTVVVHVDCTKVYVHLDTDIAKDIAYELTDNEAWDVESVNKWCCR